jgi:hypothetical protein
MDIAIRDEPLDRKRPRLGAGGLVDRGRGHCATNGGIPRRSATGKNRLRRARHKGNQVLATISAASP